MIIFKHRTTITSDFSEITYLRQWLKEKLKPSGTPDDTVYDVTLATTEACANIIKHAYGQHDDQEIIIRAEIDSDNITLTIQDFGEKFDTDNYRRPDMETPREDGYGVHLIHSLMDDVSYNTEAENGTTLRMVKHRSNQ
jgi:anti-sigma regulatory factor (Ser/Thr protein kinase)